MLNRASLVLMLLGACGHPEVELQGDGLSKGKVILDGPTWSNGVATILQDNCVRCHRMGQLATYRPYDTYLGARPRAETIAIRAAGATRGYPQMPPFTADATEDCIPEHGYSNDLSLTQAEIDTLVTWAANGAPYGTAPGPVEPLIPTTSTTLSGAVEYPFTEGVTISIENENMHNEYKCVIFDPGTIAKTRKMSGIQINPDVDHLFKSAQVFLDPGRASLAYVAADSTRTHGATWYDCDDGPGFEGQLLTSFLAGTFPPAVGSVAPGGVVVPPFLMPAGSAVTVPGDALFVAKILYHPHWANLDPLDTNAVVGALSWVDHTSLSIKWELRSAALKTAQLFHFGNATELGVDGTGLLTAPFEVPGTPVDAIPEPHTEIMSALIPGPSTDTYAVYSILPVMGEEGTKVEVRNVAASDGGEECLGAVSSWDLDFQDAAEYSDLLDGRPIVHGGDTVTVECTYENRTQNALYLDPGPQQERCEATVGLVKL